MHAGVGACVDSFGTSAPYASKTSCARARAPPVHRNPVGPVLVGDGCRVPHHGVFDAQVQAATA
eukprot:3881992-Pleurochrysis_carterae.AAC.1